MVQVIIATGEFTGMLYHSSPSRPFMVLGYRARTRITRNYHVDPFSDVLLHQGIMLFHNRVTFSQAILL